MGGTLPLEAVGEPFLRAAPCRTPDHRSARRAGSGPAGEPVRLSGVLVVAAPPLVGRSLGGPRRRVLPLLLAAERGQVEKGPDGAQRFDAAVRREVGAVDLVALADECAQAEHL